MLHLLPDAITSLQPSSRRLAALGLICLLGGATLARELHLSLVRHVQCVTHGDWMHAGEATVTAPLPAGVDAASATPAEGVHQHEHDDLTILTAAREVAAPALAALPRSSPGATHAPPERLSCTRRLYALAPKSSPPPS